MSALTPPTLPWRVAVGGPPDPGIPGFAVASSAARSPAAPPDGATRPARITTTIALPGTYFPR